MNTRRRGGEARGQLEHGREQSAFDLEANIAKITNMLIGAKADQLIELRWSLKQIKDAAERSKENAPKERKGSLTKFCSFIDTYLVEILEKTEEVLKTIAEKKANLEEVNAEEIKSQIGETVSKKKIKIEWQKDLAELILDVVGVMVDQATKQEVGDKPKDRKRDEKDEKKEESLEPSRTLVRTSPATPALPDESTALAGWAEKQREEVEKIKEKNRRGDEEALVSEAERLNLSPVKIAEEAKDVQQVIDRSEIQAALDRVTSEERAGTIDAKAAARARKIIMTEVAQASAESERREREEEARKERVLLPGGIGSFNRERGTLSIGLESQYTTKQGGVQVTGIESSTKSHDVKVADLIPLYRAGDEKGKNMPDWFSLYLGYDFGVGYQYTLGIQLKNEPLRVKKRDRHKLTYVFKDGEAKVKISGPEGLQKEFTAQGIDDLHKKIEMAVEEIRSHHHKHVPKQTTESKRVLPRSEPKYLAESKGEKEEVELTPSLRTKLFKEFDWIYGKNIRLGHDDMWVERRGEDDIPLNTLIDELWQVKTLPPRWKNLAPKSTPSIIAEALEQWREQEEPRWAELKAEIDALPEELREERLLARRQALYERREQAPRPPRQSLAEKLTAETYTSEQRSALFRRFTDVFGKSVTLGEDDYVIRRPGNRLETIEFLAKNIVAAAKLPDSWADLKLGVTKEQVAKALLDWGAEQKLWWDTLYRAVDKELPLEEQQRQFEVGIKAAYGRPAPRQESQSSHEWRAGDTGWLSVFARIRPNRDPGEKPTPEFIPVIVLDVSPTGKALRIRAADKRNPLPPSLPGITNQERYQEEGVVPLDYVIDKEPPDEFIRKVEQVSDGIPSRLRPLRSDTVPAGLPVVSDEEPDLPVPVDAGVSKQEKDNREFVVGQTIYLNPRGPGQETDRYIPVQVAEISEEGKAKWVRVEKANRDSADLPELDLENPDVRRYWRKSHFLPSTWFEIDVPKEKILNLVLPASKRQRRKTVKTVSLQEPITQTEPDDVFRDMSDLVAAAIAKPKVTTSTEPVVRPVSRAVPDPAEALGAQPSPDVPVVDAAEPTPDSIEQTLATSDIVSEATEPVPPEVRRAVRKELRNLEMAEFEKLAAVWQRLTPEPQVPEGYLFEKDGAMLTPDALAEAYAQYSDERVEQEFDVAISGRELAEAFLVWWRIREKQLNAEMEQEQQQMRVAAPARPAPDRARTVVPTPEVKVKKVIDIPERTLMTILRGARIKKIVSDTFLHGGDIDQKKQLFRGMFDGLDKEAREWLTEELDKAGYTLAEFQNEWREVFADRAFEMINAYAKREEIQIINNMTEWQRGFVHVTETAKFAMTNILPIAVGTAVAGTGLVIASSLAGFGGRLMAGAASGAAGGFTRGIAKAMDWFRKGADERNQNIQVKLSAVEEKARVQQETLLRERLGERLLADPMQLAAFMSQALREGAYEKNVPQPQQAQDVNAYLLRESVARRLEKENEMLLAAHATDAARQAEVAGEQGQKLRELDDWITRLHIKNATQRDQLIEAVKKNPTMIAGLEKVLGAIRGDFGSAERPLEESKAKTMAKSVLVGAAAGAAFAAVPWLREAVLSGVGIKLGYDIGKSMDVRAEEERLVREVMQHVTLAESLVAIDTRYGANVHSGGPREITHPGRLKEIQVRLRLPMSMGLLEKNPSLNARVQNVLRRIDAYLFEETLKDARAEQLLEALKENVYHLDAATVEATDRIKKQTGWRRWAGAAIGGLAGFTVGATWELIRGKAVESWREWNGETPVPGGVTGDDGRTESTPLRPPIAAEPTPEPISPARVETRGELQVPDHLLVHKGEGLSYSATRDVLYEPQVREGYRVALGKLYDEERLDKIAEAVRAHGGDVDPTSVKKFLSSADASYLRKVAGIINDHNDFGNLRVRDIDQVATVYDPSVGHHRLISIVDGKPDLNDPVTRHLYRESGVRESGVVEEIRFKSARPDPAGDFVALKDGVEISGLVPDGSEYVPGDGFTVRVDAANLPDQIKNLSLAVDVAAGSGSSVLRSVDNAFTVSKVSSGGGVAANALYDVEFKDGSRLRALTLDPKSAELKLGPKTDFVTTNVESWQKLTSGGSGGTAGREQTAVKSLSKDLQFSDKAQVKQALETYETEPVQSSRAETTITPEYRAAAESYHGALQVLEVKLEGTEVVGEGGKTLRNKLVQMLENHEVAVKEGRIPRTNLNEDPESILENLAKHSPDFTRLSDVDKNTVAVMMAPKNGDKSYFVMPKDLGGSHAIKVFDSSGDEYILYNKNEIYLGKGEGFEIVREGKVTSGQIEFRSGKPRIVEAVPTTS